MHVASAEGVECIWTSMCVRMRMYGFYPIENHCKAFSRNVLLHRIWSLCSGCITSCRAGRWPLRFDAEALRSHGIKFSVIRHTLLCHAVLRYPLRREHDERAAFADHAVKKGHVRRNESQKRHRKDSPRGRSALGPCCSLCLAWPPSRAECVPY